MQIITDPTTGRRTVDFLGEMPTLRLLDGDAAGELPELVTRVADWLGQGEVGGIGDESALQLVARDATGEIADAWLWRWPAEGGAYLTPAQRRRVRCLRVAIDCARARRDRPGAALTLHHGHPMPRMLTL